jgi:hypothetical protein
LLSFWSYFFVGVQSPIAILLWSYMYTKLV